MTTIALSTANPMAIAADAVVVGITADGEAVRLLAGADRVDRAVDGSLAVTLTALGATGKRDEVTKVATAKTAVVVAVGLGPQRDEGTPAHRESLRRAAGTAARALRGIRSAVFALPITTPADAAAVAEGIVLGAYAFNEYKSGVTTPPLATATITGATAKAKDVKAAVERAELVATAVNQARSWVNTPARDLTPQAFAEAAKRHAKGLKLHVEVMDESALAAGGYGGIVGVGQGSANPRGWCASPTVRSERRGTWRWWARASPSTLAACP